MQVMRGSCTLFNLLADIGDVLKQINAVLNL
jgi:hypothetical protein